MVQFVGLALLGMITATTVWLERPRQASPFFDHDLVGFKTPVKRIKPSLRFDGKVARAVVSDGQGGMYVGTLNGWLYALAPDHSVRWVQQLDSGIHAPISVDKSGAMVVGTLGATVLKVHPDGMIQWQVHVDAPIRGGVAHALDHSLIYVAAGSRLWAFSEGGNVVWTFDFNGEIDSQPIVDANSIYVGVRDHRVHSLNATSGQQQWTFATFDDLDSTGVIVHDDSLYFAGDDEELRAFTLEGSLRWKEFLGASVRAPIAQTHHGNILVRTGGPQPALWNIGTDGRKQWVTRLGLSDLGNRIVKSPPLELDSGNIAIVTIDDELVYLNPSGSPKQRTLLEAHSDAPLILGDHRNLFVVTVSGALYSVPVPSSSSYR